MIEVIIRHKGADVELGRIEIENVSDSAGEMGHYSVRFAVERIGRVGLHQRGILDFPRTKYNVLALLLQALNTLVPEDLELDGEPTPDKMSLLGLPKGNIFKRSH